MTKPRPPQGRDNIPGPETIAGAFLLRDALQRLDEPTRAIITKNVADVLPQTLQPGKLAPQRRLRPDDLQLLIPSAAISAAGLNPARLTGAAPPVLWDNGSNRLLIHPGGVRATLGDGMIEVSIPVSCDQAGDTEVTVTFVTGSPDRPTGGVTTAEDHPRGSAVIVENWHDPLIAFAWQTILVATSALSSAIGTDVGGDRLITNSLAVNADGLTVVPMAQHTFAQASRLT